MASFKVIIVGGGPCGIIAAHTLYHAGIDFVVLECRQDVFKDTGASLVLSPHSLRIMHQLGILTKLESLGAPVLHLTQSFDPVGTRFKRTYGFARMKENHGHAFIMFHRAHLLRALFDALPARVKAVYHTRKIVTSIQTLENGVVVACGDGSLYNGSIVLGADGAHSKVRHIMANLATKPADLEQVPNENPDPISPGQFQPFTAAYKCLWGSLERETEMGESYEIQAHHRSAMYLGGKKKAWIFLYERLPEPTSQRVTYSKEEVAAFAETFAHWQVHEKLKVGEIINRPGFVSGISLLQEGVVERLSWSGRIVLVGDAAHQFTPNVGFGFNNGIQDIVCLSNELNSLIQSEGSPQAIQLEQAFKRYQNQRRGPVVKDFKASALATRLQAWATWKHYFLSRWVFSWGFMKTYIADNWIAPPMKSGLVLDYIPSTEIFTGRVPWDHQLSTEHEVRPRA